MAEKMLARFGLALVGFTILLALALAGPTAVNGIGVIGTIAYAVGWLCLVVGLITGLWAVGYGLKKQDEHGIDSKGQETLDAPKGAALSPEVFAVSHELAVMTPPQVVRILLVRTSRRMAVAISSSIPSIGD